jgi:hypothetical protein
VRHKTAAASSQQENDQDDQENRAQPASDIGAAIVEATAAEHDQQDDDQQNQIHGIDSRDLLNGPITGKVGLNRGSIVVRITFPQANVALVISPQRSRISRPREPSPTCMAPAPREHHNPDMWFRGKLPHQRRKQVPAVAGLASSGGR